MAKNEDFIPDDDPGFFDWQDNYVTMVVANFLAWLIPLAAKDDLVAKQAAYVPLYNAIKVKSNRTTAQVGAHRAGRFTYEKYLRSFNKQYTLFNNAITIEKKLELEITVPDTEPSSRKAIETSPFVKLFASAGARIKAECRVDNDSSRASMHPDADEVEVAYEIGTDPAGWEKCTKKITSSKARFFIPFASEDIGKKVYFFFRWKNKTDESKSGPFTAKMQITVTD